MAADGGAPVRDVTTLTNVMYGPGHEKFPSWPMSAAAQAPRATRAPPTGGSQRSKSWTDHTSYPKESPPAPCRPYMRRAQSAYPQQLKTVVEYCETNPPNKSYDYLYKTNPLRSCMDPNDMSMQPDKDINNDKDLGKSQDYKMHGDDIVSRDIYNMENRLGEDPVKGYMNDKPHVEEGMRRDYMDHRVGKPLGEDGMQRDYIDHRIIKPHGEDSIRDPFLENRQPEPQLTMAEIEKYISNCQSSMELQLLRASYPSDTTSEGYHSGYHSFVSSTDSTFTPLIDSLRRDIDPSAIPSVSSWDRDSLATSSSESASSSETLKWHGMSDESVASSSHKIRASHQLVAHSSRVQTPQKQNSESVVYIGNEGDGPHSLQRSSLNVTTNNHHQEADGMLTSLNYSPPSPQRSVAERVHIYEEKTTRYTYLDPTKQTKVSDPVLKAIQKKALLSFYERHQDQTRKKAPSKEISERNSKSPAMPGPMQQVPQKQSQNNMNQSLPLHRDSREISTNMMQQNNIIDMDYSWPVPERPPKNQKRLRSVFPDLYTRGMPQLGPNRPIPSKPFLTKDDVNHRNKQPLPVPPYEVLDEKKYQEHVLNVNSCSDYPQMNIVTPPKPVKSAHNQLYGSRDMENSSLTKKRPINPFLRSTSMKIGADNKPVYRMQTSLCESSMVQKAPQFVAEDVRSGCIMNKPLNPECVPSPSVNHHYPTAPRNMSNKTRRQDSESLESGASDLDAGRYKELQFRDGEVFRPGSIEAVQAAPLMVSQQVKPPLQITQQPTANHDSAHLQNGVRQSSTMRITMLQAPIVVIDKTQIDTKTNEADADIVEAMSNSEHTTGTDKIDEESINIQLKDLELDKLTGDMTNGLHILPVDISADDLIPQDVAISHGDDEEVGCDAVEVSKDEVLALRRKTPEELAWVEVMPRLFELSQLMEHQELQTLLTQYEDFDATILNILELFEEELRYETEKLTLDSSSSAPADITRFEKESIETSTDEPTDIKSQARASLRSLDSSLRLQLDALEAAGARNEATGSLLAARAPGARLARYAQDLGLVSALMASLVTRLARPGGDVPDQHGSFISKRTKLEGKLAEAKQLKTGIDLRGRTLSLSLAQQLGDEGTKKYRGFISTKVRLAIYTRDVQERLDLCEKILDLIV